MVSVKVPTTHAVSREGVNAVQALFESGECVFQEVAQQNDIGKDAYVDISQEGLVTGTCAALQIKSGESFRASHGDYFITVGKHSDSWRGSTVPVFGLVYDPSDRLLRWADWIPPRSSTTVWWKHSGTSQHDTGRAQPVRRV